MLFIGAKGKWYRKINWNLGNKGQASQKDKYTESISKEARDTKVVVGSCREHRSIGTVRKMLASFSLPAQEPMFLLHLLYSREGRIKYSKSHTELQTTKLHGFDMCISMFQVLIIKWLGNITLQACWAMCFFIISLKGFIILQQRN